MLSSTAASTSERIASESAEASTAQSESERIAQSTSTSASVSESISSSESASTSAAASEAANNSGNSGNGGITYTSASEINENATNAAEYNEVNNVAGNAAGTNVNTFNEVGGAGIEDAQVPLAVRLDDDLVDEDVAIKDEETPLAVEKSGISGRTWWYWILIIISAITGNVAKNKEKATQKEMEEKDK